MIRSSKLFKKTKKQKQKNANADAAVIGRAIIIFL